MKSSIPVSVRALKARCRRRSGFTLLELTVSLAVLSIGVLVVLQSFQLLLRTVHDTRQTVRVQFLMADLLCDPRGELIERAAADGRCGGRFPAPDSDFAWELTALAREVPGRQGQDSDGEDVQLLQLTVRVRRDGWDRTFERVTCRRPEA